MTRCNPNNARLIRRYLDQLRHSEGLQPITLQHTANAIAEFEAFIHGSDFQRFKRKSAIAFQEALLMHQQQGGGSLATVHSKLLRVEKFHRWLALEAGFKRKIRLSDVACFSLSRKDQTRARQRRERPTPSFEQVLKTIRSMPAGTDVELRDRAVMILLFLTGIRGQALASLKLKHLLANGRGVDQDSTEVATKGGKRIVSFFLPLDPAIKRMFDDYVDHLRSDLGFCDSDPLFPATLRTENGVFVTGALARRHWGSTDPLRRICRSAFLGAGDEVFTPHAIRRTLVREAERRSKTAEQFMALAQNVGHSDPTTSFRSYGTIPLSRQAELIAELVDPAAAASSGAAPDRIAELMEQLLEVLQQSSSSRREQ